MTLTLVFRIMAFFTGFWGVGMWLAPGTLAGNWNWDLTHDLSVMMQFMGTMMILFGVIHWKMPDWAGDNLKTPGMTFAIFHTVLMALNLFQLFMHLKINKLLMLSRASCLKKKLLNLLKKY